jgi:hypothetical protein
VDPDIQFLASRSGLPLRPEFRAKFVHTLKIDYFRRDQVQYFLDAPIVETESYQVTRQAIWLAELLRKVRPNHLDWFLTPDTPGGRR